MVAANDDQDLPAVEVGPHVGHADAVEQQLALPPAGTPSCWPRRPPAGRRGPRGRPPSRATGLRRPARCPCATGSSSTQTASPSSAARVSPSSTIVMTSAPDVVEQRDAGVDDDLGAEVGIAAGDARRGVDHRRDAGRRRAPRRATRSRSTWSMIAMSPGLRRLVRFLVRRSTRATPDDAGQARAAAGARAIGASSPVDPARAACRDPPERAG